MDRRVVFPRSLQYLIAIAEYGSFTRAAEALYVSQPTLSQQIKQLEDSLQTQLLDRSGRQIRLTDAGEIYLRHARRAQSELDAGTRAINDVQDLSKGSLRIGWTPITDHMTCCLLEKFNSLYPGITISTTEMPQDDITEAVSDGRIDVGITFSQPSKITSSGDIQAQILFEEVHCLAIGNGHSLAGHHEQMEPDELALESMVLLNTHFALRQHIDEYCKNHKIEPRIVVETNSLSVIIEMIQSGSLSTILPSSIVRSQCGLQSIMFTHELPRKSLTLISRDEGYKSPACNAFVELALSWAIRRLHDIPAKKLNPCLHSKSNAKPQLQKNSDRKSPAPSRSSATKISKTV